MKDKHLKLKLRDSEGRNFEAVWWDGVDRSSHVELKRGGTYEIAYSPEANTWRGVARLQLVLKDIREN